MKKILLILLLFKSPLIQAQPKPFSNIDSLTHSIEVPSAPGFSIGIVKDGQLIYQKNSGMANLEYHIPISDSSVFGLASLSKQFTAACTWILIKHKQLSLDDDIRKYLPELPDYGDTIKIRHLLNHTSGIRNYHTLMDLAGFDYDKEYHTNADILALACKQKGLNNKPGTKILYGNTGYTLLAVIIERIAGEDLNTFAQKHLFKPLGMMHTQYVTDNQSIIQNRAYGYALQEGRYIQFPHNQVTYGAGSMASTVQDLAIWAAVLTQDNIPYSDLTTFLSNPELLPGGETAGYARGLMIAQYKGFKTVHHSGFSAGGQTQLLTIPELGITVIILTNNVSINPVPLSYQIVDKLLPYTATKPAARSIKPALKKSTTKDNVLYTGTYIELNSDMRMDIIQKGDSLYARGTQSKQPAVLIPQGKGRFCRRNNESVRYIFYTDAHREYEMSISFGGTPFYFRKAVFVTPESVQAAEYTGKFYSEELQATYIFTVKDQQLSLLHPLRGVLHLHPTTKDAFGNGERVSYQFLRDSSGKIYALQVAAEGTVRDISFLKQFPKEN